MRTDRVVGYHGSAQPVTLTGSYWLALDRDYAEGYAGAGGVVIEVEVAGRILDLRHLGIDVTSAALREALREAGVEPPARLGDDGDDEVPPDEMHARVPLFERAAREAGYDAIAIREWTAGVGETDSVRVLGD